MKVSIVRLKLGPIPEGETEVTAQSVPAPGYIESVHFLEVVDSGIAQFYLYGEHSPYQFVNIAPLQDAYVTPRIPLTQRDGSNVTYNTGHIAYGRYCLPGPIRGYLEGEPGDLIVLEVIVSH